LQLFKQRDNPDKLKLSINGQNILNWFKQKFKELQKTTETKLGKNKGFRM